MASSTSYSGIRITWLGHASILLEGDGMVIYVDPFLVPRGAKPAHLILYTHGHHDHCAPAPSITAESTVVIGHKCKIPVRVIEVGSREKVGGVIVEAVHAYNTDKPFHPKGQGAGYILRFRNASVYIAGDTDAIPEMENFKCDVAIVPIGGTYTMDAREAAEAILLIKPKLAIPVHYNYLSDTAANPQDFKKAVEEYAPSISVCILDPLR